MTDLDRITQQIQFAAASIPYGGADTEIDSAYGQIWALAQEGRELIDAQWREARSTRSPLKGAADLMKDLGI